MLTSLPARSLTQLNLCQLLGRPHGPAVSAALARLSNLQQLRIATQWTGANGPYSYLAGVAQLTGLTSFELSGQWSGSEQPLPELLVQPLQQLLAQPLQQLLAQPLPLRVLRLQVSCDLPLDLSQCTQLQELSASLSAYDVVFPPQLQQLQLGKVAYSKLVPAAALQSVMQLQHLQRLEFAADLEEPVPLLPRLARLTALQQLALTYRNGRLAAAGAPAWQHLPQLCELEFLCVADYVGRQGWKTIMVGLAAATSLTKLKLSVFRWLNDNARDEDEVEDEADRAPGAQLAALKKLKHLSIIVELGNSKLQAPGNAFVLAALTGLTHLQLIGLGRAMGDYAATAIAGSCQQLRHLDLTWCNLVSMECLATVRQLTQLTELQLTENAGLTRQGLMLLTGLRRLQRLGVNRSAEVTDEVVEGFWAAVKGQQL